MWICNDGDDLNKDACTKITMKESYLPHKNLALKIQDLLCNYDLRHGREFDYNLQALLDRGARLLIDFNAFRNYVQFTVLAKFHMYFKMNVCHKWI